MTDSRSSDTKPISLEDLNALNDEIASLVRAGIPLELGLTGFRSNVRGRLAKVTEDLSSRLAAGDDLVEILTSERDRFPTVYAALVEAGLRAGRLPEALESLTTYSASVLDLRRRIGVATMYPAVVVVLAFVVCTAFAGVMAPLFVSTFRSLNVAAPLWLPAMQIMHDTLPYWGIGVPLVVLLACVWAQYRNRGVAGASFLNGGLALLAWLPGMKSVSKNFHRAGFTELAALLVDQQVPLHDAIRLAGQATPSSKIQAAAEDLSRRLESGESLATGLRSVRELPPFLKWMMVNGQSQNKLALSLRQMTEVYRRRAMNRAEWVKVLVPVFLVIVIGGGATLTYALMMFVPLSQLLKGING